MCHATAFLQAARDGGLDASCSCSAFACLPGSGSKYKQQGSRSKGQTPSGNATSFVLHSPGAAKALAVVAAADAEGTRYHVQGVPGAGQWDSVMQAHRSKQALSAPDPAPGHTPGVGVIYRTVCDHEVWVPHHCHAACACARIPFAQPGFGLGGGGASEG